jgi:hypothetical protein
MEGERCVKMHRLLKMFKHRWRRWLYMGLDIVNLPVGRIKKDPMNLREDGDVDELVEEIKRVGFTNPHRG